MFQEFVLWLFNTFPLWFQIVIMALSINLGYTLGKWAMLRRMKGWTFDSHNISGKHVANAEPNACGKVN